MLGSRGRKPRSHQVYRLADLQRRIGMFKDALSLRSSIHGNTVARGR